MISTNLPPKADWFDIGFRDGKFNQNGTYWTIDKAIHVGYADGLKAGKRQRKEDQLEALLKHEIT